MRARSSAASRLTPEVHLVLLSVQRVRDDQTLRSLLGRELNWNWVLQAAQHERMELPLWRMVKGTGLGGAPAAHLQALERLGSVWEFKMLRLEQMLHRTLARFDDAGISSVLLKGGAAAYTVHRGFSDRPMGDVDLLIRPERAEEALAIALDVGWIWDEEKYPRDAYAGAHHLPPLQDSARSGVFLELHTTLMKSDHPFTFSEVDVWRDAVGIDLGAVTVRVPSPVHHLLHICVHFAWSHVLETHSLRTFHDIAGLQEKGIDWSEFVALAKRTNTETCCYWTLRLSEALAGIPIPAEVLRALRPTGSAFTLRRLERHFVLSCLPGQHPCPSVKVTRFMWRKGIQRGPAPGRIVLPSTPIPKGLWQRVVDHLHGLGAWFRYLARIA